MHLCAPLCEALRRRFRHCHARTALVFLALCATTALACWDDAAARHGVPRELLLAIARTESGMQARAVHRNADRAASYDIGLMQINSSHLPMLRRFGIDDQALLDPCINVHVWAWILADLRRRMGPGWDAVGAYNASCTKLRGADCTRARARYAWRVHRNLVIPAPVDGQPLYSSH